MCFSSVLVYIRIHMLFAAYSGVGLPVYEKSILKMHSEFLINYYFRYFGVPTIIPCIFIIVIYRITEYRHMSR